MDYRQLQKLMNLKYAKKVTLVEASQCSVDFQNGKIEFVGVRGKDDYLIRSSIQRDQKKEVDNQNS